MVTREEIEKLAYSLWEQDGCPEGKDVSHYYEAERLLRERDGMEKKASVKKQPRKSRQPSSR
jgi:hypothetical protein